MKPEKPYYLYWFLIPYALFFIALFSLILIYDKGELHLLMNTVHTPVADTFFKYYTELGGALPFVIAAIFLFHRVGSSLYILVTLGLNAIVTNLLKTFFGEPRPIRFFELYHPDKSLPIVEGVRLFTANGFPSGHTSATFALMTCIMLMAKRRDVSLIVFVAAALLGYSRIYLSQHFAEDVLFGSAVGVAMGFLLYFFYLFLLRKHPRFNQSVIALFRDRNH